MTSESKPLHFQSGKSWTMFHGECTEVLEQFTDKSIGVAIFDPPYSARVHNGVRSARVVGLPDSNEFECRTRRAVDLGFEHLTARLRRAVAKECARLVRRWSMAFSDEDSMHLWRRSFDAVGLQHVRSMFWDRIGGAPQFTGDRPAVAVEAITLAHPRGKKEWNGGGKQGIYRHPIVQNRGGNTPRVHTTQKPIGLMLELVVDFSEPGETVLDMFAGSGTTGVACIRHGRQFIGIERAAVHFETACERLRAEEQGSTLEAARLKQQPLFGDVK